MCAHGRYYCEQIRGPDDLVLGGRTKGEQVAQADAGAGGLLDTSGTAGTMAALAGTELRRWQMLCDAMEGADCHPWSEAEARTLVEAVLTAVLHGKDENLDAASRAWASTAVSMPVLVRRIGCLRELLLDEGLVEGRAAGDRLQRVLDTVTTLATETALAELEDAALTDALTGAGNRRALESAGRAALAAAARTGAPLSVAVIDLDGLKAINDTEGHAAGDATLARLSTALGSALRETDQLFRIGGDEFVALLPLAAPDAVVHLMHRAQRFEAPSFSWGVASAPGDGTELADLLQTADTRLYAARRAAGYYAGTRPGEHRGPPSPPVAVPAVPPAVRARSRPRPLSVVLAALLPIAAVLALVFATPSSPTASPPATTPATRPPAGQAPSGPGSSVTHNGTGGPAPSGTPSGQAPSGPAPTGTSAPAGTTGPAPGPGGTSPTGSPTTTPPPPSTTTTAPSGGTQQPVVTLPPIGPTGLTGTGLGG